MGLHRRLFLLIFSLLLFSALSPVAVAAPAPRAVVAVLTNTSTFVLQQSANAPRVTMTATTFRIFTVMPAKRTVDLPVSSGIIVKIVFALILFLALHVALWYLGKWCCRRRASRGQTQSASQSTPSQSSQRQHRARGQRVEVTVAGSTVTVDTHLSGATVVVPSTVRGDGSNNKLVKAQKTADASVEMVPVPPLAGPAEPAAPVEASS
ncbi:hypothetical protein B0H10DRAFT_2212779 [Mycena sp. CBHHK59/15]|nr:hypothetical protein B0H10DRAFT_2212779 [Mycena sp. CBHHK59/15]